MAFGNLVNKTTTAGTGTGVAGLKKPTLGGLKPPTAGTAPKLGGLKPPMATAKMPAVIKPTNEELIDSVDEILQPDDAPVLTDSKIEETIQQAVEESKAEVVATVAVEPVVEEEVVEETAKVTPEVVVEKAAPEVTKEVAEEVVNEKEPVVEIVKETLEPPTADTEKAAARRKATSKKATKEVKSESEGSITKEEFEIIEAEMNFCAFDEEFEMRKEELIEMANAIEIPADVTPGQIIGLIADLDALNREVWVDYFELKTRFTNLTAVKPEGKIERIKRINRTGKNDSDRERNGLIACQSYNTVADVTVDLLAYQDVLRYRYNFFQSIFDYIATKRQMLITVQACLKTESSL